MPLETITCRACGSGEVTEFEPGSYVCAHCEAVFKHAPASSGGGGVGCEVDACSVAAVGRCDYCGRAFCRTHQGWESEPGLVVMGQVMSYNTNSNLCRPCAGERKAAADAKAAEERRLAEQKRAEEQDAMRRRLGRTADPIERLVLATSCLLRPAGSGYLEVVDDMRPIWDEMFPSARQGPMTGAFSKAPVILEDGDAQLVSAWFARRALSRGLGPNSSCMLAYGRHGRKQKRVPCWGPFQGKGLYGSEAHGFKRGQVLLDGEVAPKGFIFDVSGLRLMAWVLQLPGASGLLSYSAEWQPVMDTLRC